MITDIAEIISHQVDSCTWTRLVLSCGGGRSAPPWFGEHLHSISKKKKKRRCYYLSQYNQTPICQQPANKTLTHLTALKSPFLLCLLRDLSRFPTHQLFTPQFVTWIKWRICANKTSYHSHWRNENSLKEILKKKSQDFFLRFYNCIWKKGNWWWHDLEWEREKEKRKEGYEKEGRWIRVRWGRLSRIRSRWKVMFLFSLIPCGSQRVCLGWICRKWHAVVAFYCVALLIAWMCVYNNSIII